jgi:hypothetical protein
MRNTGREISVILHSDLYFVNSYGFNILKLTTKFTVTRDVAENAFIHDNFNHVNLCFLKEIAASLVKLF